jgi:hypothetical protein
MKKFIVQGLAPLGLTGRSGCPLLFYPGDIIAYKPPYPPPVGIPRLEPYTGDEEPKHVFSVGPIHPDMRLAVKTQKVAGNFEKEVEEVIEEVIEEVAEEEIFVGEEEIVTQTWALWELNGKRKDQLVTIGKSNGLELDESKHKSKLLEVLIPFLDNLNKIR